MRLKAFLALLVCLCCVITFAAKQNDPFSGIPAEGREALAKRLEAFVRENRTHDWYKLYELISDIGKGKVTPEIFVARMNSAHGAEFANSPDLLEFLPNRAEQAGRNEWDIYGCGKARREGRMYNGIAVAHAVFEHDGWFFSGWSFTEFPNEPCKALSDPRWKPENAIGFDHPMEELH